MVTEVLLTCIICFTVIVVSWMYFNGSREREISGNKNDETSTACASNENPLVQRENWMIKSEDAVSSLNEQLQRIPENMRIFSTAMRSLYAEQQVNSGVKTAKEFLALRDDTKRDALVYVRGILPVSEKLVRSIGEFFDLYETLDMQTWKKHLSYIIDEVRGYKQCCKEVVRLHTDIMKPLKEKEDRAKVMLKKMDDLTKEYEKKMRSLEQKATKKRGIGNTFAFIPFLNVIIAPFLFVGADTAAAEAVATGFQMSINEAATLAVGKTMIPALASFIGGIEIAAGFFAIMENELTTFQERGEKASGGAMELHFRTMKSKAKEIKRSCRSFFAVVPAVQSDFSCIPSTPNDSNYVDEWLAEQRNHIRQKYKNNITKSLSQMITSLAQANPFKMIGSSEACLE